MENLQLKTPIWPRAADKTAPANDISTADTPGTRGTRGATGAAPTEFQALLQQCIGSEGVPLAAVTDSPRLSIAATDAPEETEHDCAELAAACVSPAEPPLPLPLPLLMMLPAQAPVAAAVSPPVAAGNTPALPPAPAGTAEIPPSKPADKNEPGGSPSVQFHAPEALTGVETTIAERGPARFLQKSEETQFPRTTEALPEHPLQPHAERHDAAVTELPRFAQGVPLTESARAPARLDTPVGAPEWNDEFAQKMVWIAGDKQHSAQLHVNPPDLGPVHIRLSIDEHQTSAIFTSPHGEVRQAIEEALPRLREVLAESGITLGNASVTSDSPRDGSAFDRQRPSPPSFAGTAGAGGSDTLTKAEPGRVIPRGRGNGLVDVFA